MSTDQGRWIQRAAERFRDLGHDCPTCSCDMESGQLRLVRNGESIRIITSDGPVLRALTLEEARDLAAVLTDAADYECAGPELAEAAGAAEEPRP
jgi:hypothetical protein